MLVRTLEQGRDLAKTLGNHTCGLMRGHGAVVVAGSIQAAVLTAVYMLVNANVEREALTLGKPEGLSADEIRQSAATALPCSPPASMVPAGWIKTSTPRGSRRSAVSSSETRSLRVKGWFARKYLNLPTQIVSGRPDLSLSRFASTTLKRSERKSPQGLARKGLLRKGWSALAEIVGLSCELRAAYKAYGAGAKASNYAASH
jgi:hypothetical protein